jgi:putative intracellular protease/amidase
MLKPSTDAMHLMNSLGRFGCLDLSDSRHVARHQPPLEFESNPEIMNRRQFTKAAALTTGFGAIAAVRPLLAAKSEQNKKTASAESTAKRLEPPSEGPITVAVLVSEGVNVIDFSGPWGVFESVMLPHAQQMPFRLIAVSEATELVTSPSGLKIKPDYTFANLPAPNVVVIPAQKGSDAMRDWLTKNWQTTDVTMSVCTGAFQLAKAGLLNGKPATTHHEFLDELAKRYPEIQVKRGVRFVENEKISTAGGLTSGTDLALRVVERYFGREIAQNTARYMEYRGTDWMV